MRHALTGITRAGYCIACLALPALAIATDDNLSSSPWSYRVDGAAGYFGFRDSLYSDLEPDPPGIPGDDRLEFFVKPGRNETTESMIQPGLRKQAGPMPIQTIKKPDA